MSNENKTVQKTKLRASITPGTVVILLATRYRGKRAVVLKQLDSGLLLVTGPFKINGVPLRRVNQRYVIATSTKIELKGDPAAGITDAFFPKLTKSEEKTEKKEEKSKLPASNEFKSKQSEVDGAIVSLFKKGDFMKSYLASTFSLSKGQFPHRMKF